MQKAKPGLTFAEVSKELSKMWKELKDSEKSKYKELAKQDKARFQREQGLPCLPCSLLFTLFVPLSSFCLSIHARSIVCARLENTEEFFAKNPEAKEAMQAARQSKKRKRSERDADEEGAARDEDDEQPAPKKRKQACSLACLHLLSLLFLSSFLSLSLFFMLPFSLSFVTFLCFFDLFGRASPQEAVRNFLSFVFL